MSCQAYYPLIILPARTGDDYYVILSGIYFSTSTLINIIQILFAASGALSDSTVILPTPDDKPFHDKKERVVDEKSYNLNENCFKMAINVKIM